MARKQNQLDLDCALYELGGGFVDDVECAALRKQASSELFSRR